MSGEEKIVKMLGEIKSVLASNQSDYCDTDEACRIIGVTNMRYLAQLFQRDLLPRYKRGEGFKYKKSDCYKIAAKLDSGDITLEPINKRKAS